jgi:response regulator RpfG family c-di-GMP phosphodiesterase
MSKEISEIFAIIRRSELFAGLNEESIDRIASHLKKVSFEKDEIICREGEPGDSMFMIAEGEVSIEKDMGWGQRELRRMRAKEAFGEMALISREARSATVRAITRTECLQFDQEGFAALLEKDPHFAQRVAQVLTKWLSALGRKTSEELVGSYRALMFALANLADSRDPETGDHLERTRNYCVLLAEKMSKHPKYSSVIRGGFVDGIYYVSPLHDIGKVAIPDAVLLKPGRLTAEEYEVMKTHTTVGAQALGKVLEQCDEEIFHMGHKICLHHHEKWDGTGYPMKLAGEAIPVESRIMSIADVYDALLSKRVYKPPMSYLATREEIRKSAGTFFDPTMVEVVIENIALFEQVHQKYQGV